MMITKILPLVTYQKNIRTYKIFQDVIQQKLSKSIHKLIKNVIHISLHFLFFLTLLRKIHIEKLTTTPIHFRSTSPKPVSYGNENSTTVQH